MVDFVLGFVTKVFRWFVAVWIVLDVIVSTIYGGIIGSNMRDEYTFWGILLGFVFGAVTSILTGGLLATFIKIEMNTAKTLKYVSGGKEDDDLPVGVDDDDDDVYANAAPSYSAPSYGAPAPYVEARPPNDSVLIKSGQTLNGVISHKNGRDLYHVVLTQPGKLSILVTTEDIDGLLHWETYVKVLNANGREISTSGRFEFPYSVELDIPNAGIYVVEITSSKTGRYYLSVQY